MEILQVGEEVQNLFVLSGSAIGGYKQWHYGTWYQHLQQ